MPDARAGVVGDLAAYASRSTRQTMSAKDVTAIVGNEPNTTIARVGCADVLIC